MPTIDIHPSLYHSQGRKPPIFKPAEEKCDFSAEAFKKELDIRLDMEDFYGLASDFTDEEIEMKIEKRRYPDTNKY